MKTSIDCIPCFVRQTLEATRFVSPDPFVHEQVLRAILQSLAAIDFNQSPPFAGQWIHRKIRELIGSNDPYKNAKERFNKLALELLPELKTKVNASPDRLLMSSLLAITGNVIDLGAKSNLTEDDVLQNINKTLLEPFNFNIESLRHEIAKASKILYLADNAGEIVFDRLLIEELPMNRLTVVVRGKPVINDATMDDACAAGLHNIVKVINNGSDAPGTILDDCSPEFQQRFNEADLIIAKGQGNYETLSDEPGNIFFLFKIKCSVTAAHLGFKMGTNVLTETARGQKNDITKKERSMGNVR